MFIEFLFLLCLLVLFGYIVYIAFRGFPVKPYPVSSYISTWEIVATYCWEQFGTHVDWQERFFICPDCGESIYECDWEDPSDYLSDMCPICDYRWYDTEEENDERKAAGNEWYRTEEDEEMDEIDNEHDEEED